MDTAPEIDRSVGRSLIFVRSRAPLMDLPIRAFEGGDAGHVGCRVGNDVVDSTFWQGGVRVHEVEAWRASHQLVLEVPLSFHADKAEAADEWLYAQVGKPYDWTAVAGFLLWRDWSKPDTWFCSELGFGWGGQGEGWSLAGDYSRIGVRLLMEVSYARADAKGLV